MADRSTETITDQAAVTITATTTGTAWLASRYYEANFYLDVTAATAGDTSLVVTVQTGAVQAATGPWATLATFTTITAAGDYIKAVAGNLGQYIRLVYTPAGTTPSYTLSSYIVFKT